MQRIISKQMRLSCHDGQRDGQRQSSAHYGSRFRQTVIHRSNAADGVLQGGDACTKSLMFTEDISLLTWCSEHVLNYVAIVQVC